MRQKIIILSVLAVLLLGAAGFRFLQVLTYPTGGGQYKESPDKRFTAHAMSMTDCGYFSGERSYYEFTIESGPRQVLRRVVIDQLAEGMIGWREDGAIQWAADSSSVTYSFQGIQLTLTVTP